LTVGAASLNQTPLDWTGNRSRILEAIERARARQVGLLCLPEMCVTGYGCEDAFLAPDTCRRAVDGVLDIATHTAGIAVCVGLPVRYRDALFNGVALLFDGRVVGIACKQFLAGDGLHYEPRWFRAWPEGVRGEVTLGAGEGAVGVPIGDLLFDVDGVRVGFEICEDAWVAERPGARMARLGVDVVLNPSASHFAFGKQTIREGYAEEGARAFGCTYVVSNLVGNEAGRAIYDGANLIVSAGRRVARAAPLGFAESELVSAVVDIELTRANVSRTASFAPDLERDHEVVRTVGRLPRPEYTVPVDLPSVVEDKREVFSRAIALSLFDYLRRSRSQGFVLSLSGGADSAACACLVHLMVRLGVEALGVDGFKGRLGHIRRVAFADADDVRSLTSALLLCVYQRAASSSQTTEDAARAIAEAVGARFHVLDVAALVAGYTALAEQVVDRPLEWDTDDIALQNIQARARAPSVWMLANIEGALLLTTSNRSEAAVGYATMDGDTAGSIAPIAGIDKAFLRVWLVWLETDGMDIDGARFRIPALRAITAQVPTAELRPKEMEQTDEDDLMPYPVLDLIERSAIGHKRSPADCYRIVRGTFPDVSADTVLLWVERFFRLWSRNQWKRERYAPSFHVDDENLDPKTWCRFPILSGGFADELAELRAAVEAEAAGA
jgi:NAD+ synthase (glutamine-hydrolysing)